MAFLNAKSRAARARSTRCARALLCAVLISVHAPLALATAPQSAQPGQPTAAEAATAYAEAQIYELAPYAVQIVNLAMLDPVMAANLVPEPWLAALTENAFALEAEKPTAPKAAIEAKAWPIGPWQSPTSLATMISQLDPRAVASLYRALRPRLQPHCRQHQSSIEVCERAIRSSVDRLSAQSVHDRAAGRPSAPLTATQEELSRLGPPVTQVLRKKLRQFAQVLWGTPAAPVD